MQASKHHIVANIIIAHMAQLQTRGESNRIDNNKTITIDVGSVPIKTLL